MQLVYRELASITEAEAAKAEYYDQDDNKPNAIVISKKSASATHIYFLLIVNYWFTLLYYKNQNVLHNR